MVGGFDHLRVLCIISKIFAYARGILTHCCVLQHREHFVDIEPHVDNFRQFVSLRAEFGLSHHVSITPTAIYSSLLIYAPQRNIVGENDILKM